MNKYKVGLFPMCADVLHAGHIMALEEAKKHCDYLIVALNTHPEGKEPIQSVYERYIQISGVGCVDSVIPYQGKRDMEIIASTLDYDIRFLGDDYIGKKWDGINQERKRDIKKYFVGRNHDFSSTELKQRIYKQLKEKELRNED